MYQERTYRKLIKSDDLVCFEAAVKETDLQIQAERDLKAEAIEAIKGCRQLIEDYIRTNPGFRAALEPYRVFEGAPPIVKEMAEICARLGVGPMAAVAGALAEYVGKELLRYSRQVIVENGGDVFLCTGKPRKIGIFAGESPFSLKIALEINPEDTPLGVCTSSGTVGPSLSFGRADAVVAVSKSTLLADAAATAIGNIVKSGKDFDKALAFAKTVEGLRGVVLIKDDEMALCGDLKLTRI